MNHSDTIPTKYICASCNGHFTCTRSNEDLEAELVKEFGDDALDQEHVRVCEDCFKDIKEFLQPAETIH